MMLFPKLAAPLPEDKDTLALSRVPTSLATPVHGHKDKQEGQKFKACLDYMVRSV